MLFVKEFYALSPQMPKSRELALVVVLASLAGGEGWGWGAWFALWWKHEWKGWQGLLSSQLLATPARDTYSICTRTTVRSQIARRNGSLGYPGRISDWAQLLVGVLIPLTNELNVEIHTIHETTYSRETERPIVQIYTEIYITEIHTIPKMLLYGGKDVTVRFSDFVKVKFLSQYNSFWFWNFLSNSIEICVFWNTTKLS